MMKIEWTNGAETDAALGRNGGMNTVGVNMTETDNGAYLRPITTKGFVGRAMIFIPDADRKAVAKMLFPEAFDE